MTIDSIQAVQGRIAQIQQRIVGLGGGAGSTPGATSTSFAGALREAMGSTTTAVNAARPPASGGSHPPRGLEGFANGRIPEQVLGVIAPGERLWSPAANAFRQLAAAAQATGVRLRVTDSYRSFDEQVDIVRRKGLYSRGGLGAEPGRSTHGWGLSVDFDMTPETVAWLRTNAGRFGFVEDVPREPWHWTYQAPASRPPLAAVDPARLQLPR